jgi:hypothetical protein
MNASRFCFAAVVACAGLAPAACASKSPSTTTANRGPAGAGGSHGAGGAASVGGSVGTGVPDDASPPPTFWDTSNIPAAKNVMMFKFLNRTNGKFQDSEVYWSFKSGTINELHSIADQPTYDMPANNSGRMYFYICSASLGCTGDPTQSQYYDFIEHTIGPTQYNGNTTRVDAFGIKIALLLHSAMGADVSVGEDYTTFLEDRSATFAKFIAEVPTEFQHLAQPPFAPYRIVQPGTGEFKAGGLYANYYDAYVNQIWSANGLTIPMPGPNGSGLGSYPDVSAAIYRHTGGVAGSFSPTGKLMNTALWNDSTTFYTEAPADYYARFWHTHGIGGKAYGFPYDDVGGYSSYVSRANPVYMLVAIGW